MAELITPKQLQDLRQSYADQLDALAEKLRPLEAQRHDLLEKLAAVDRLIADPPSPSPSGASTEIQLRPYLGGQQLVEWAYQEALAFGTEGVHYWRLHRLLEESGKTTSSAAGLLANINKATDRFERVGSGIYRAIPPRPTVVQSS